MWTVVDSVDSVDNYFYSHLLGIYKKQCNFVAKK